MAKQIFCAKNHLFKSATHEDIKYGYRRISFYTIFMDKQGEGLVSYILLLLLQIQYQKIYQDRLHEKINPMLYITNN